MTNFRTANNCSPFFLYFIGIPLSITNDNQLNGALTETNLFIRNPPQFKFKLGYALATMPSLVSEETQYTLPYKPSVLIPIGTRVIRKNSNYEYDINTCGALLYTPNTRQFHIYVNEEMVSYVGGQPIGILFIYAD